MVNLNQCLSVVATLLMLTSYEFTAPTTSVLSNTWVSAMTGISIRNIRINNIAFPQDMTVRYDNSGLFIELGECVTLTGITDVRALIFTLSNQATDMVICGSLNYTRRLPTTSSASPDTCASAVALAPGGISCTMVAKTTVHTAIMSSNVDMDLCNEFLDVVAIEQLLGAATSAPALAAGETAVADVKLFRLAKKLVDYVESAFGFTVALTYPDETGLHLHVEQISPRDVQNLTLPVADAGAMLTMLPDTGMEAYSALVRSFLKPKSDAKFQVTLGTLLDTASLTNGPFALNMTANMSVPEGMTADVDVFIGNVQCSSHAADGSGAYNCQYPLSSLKIANVELSHLLDINTLVPQAAMVLANAYAGPLLTDNLSACDANTGVCYITHSEVVPEPMYPPLGEGNTAVQDMALFTLIADVVNGIERVFNLTPRVDFVADTAMRVRVASVAAIDLAPFYALLRRQNVTGYISDMLHTNPSLAALSRVLGTVKLTTDVVTILEDLFPSIPAGAGAEIVLVFDNLKCDAATGMDCTFPIDGGLTIGSLSVNGVSEIDYIVGQWAETLLPAVNSVLPSLVFSRLCDPTSGLCTTMSTSVAATAYPDLAADATDVKDTALVALLSGVAGSVESVFNVSVDAAPVAPTAYEVGVSTVDAVNVAGLLSAFGVDMSTLSLSAIVSSLLAGDAQALAMAQLVLSNVKLTDAAVSAIASFVAHVPGGLSARAALVYNELKCDAATGMDCTFPIVGGLGVANLAVTTPSAAVDVLVSNVQGALSSAVNSVMPSLVFSRLCDPTSGLCTTMSTTQPASSSSPPLTSSALPTSNSSLFQIMTTVVTAVDDFAGISPLFSIPTDTSVRAGVSTLHDVDIKELTNKVDAVLALIGAGVSVKSLLHTALGTYSAELALLTSNVKLTEAGEAAVAYLTETLPGGLSAEADIFFDDLQCDALSGANCSFPASVGGLQLANVRLSSPHAAVRVLVLNLQPMILPLMNALLPSVLSLALNVDNSTNRFTFLVPTVGAGPNASGSPALRADATPMSDVGMVRAVVNAANALGGIGTLKLHLSTYTNTTLLASANISERVDLMALLTCDSTKVLLDIAKKYFPMVSDLETLLGSLNTVTWPGAAAALASSARMYGEASSPRRSGEAVMTHVRTASTLSDGSGSPITAVADLLDLINFTTTTISPLITLLGNIMGGTVLNVAVSVDDLECRNGGYSCSFPTFLGLRVADLTANGVSLVDAVLAPMLPATRSVVNQKIDPMLASMPLYCSNATDGRCHITLKNEKVVKVPHFSFLIAFPILAVIAIVAIVAQNVVRRTHRITRLLPSAKDECYTSTGEPISVAHIVIEDTIVCVVAMLLFACFVMTHFTTIAYIIVGGEWTMYLFALHTVSHLWKCGLQAESTFIIVFSGALVYLKLVVLIVFAVVLHRPRCLVMRIFDVIGGFSMVLTYVLLCFYAFMETPGMIEVRMRPSFYLFVAGVFGSFLLGHYLVYFWRFGTNIRDKPFSLSDFKSSSELEGSATCPRTSSESHEPVNTDSVTGVVENDELSHHPDLQPPEKRSTFADDLKQVDKELPEGQIEGFVTHQLVHWVCEFFRHGVWWPVSIPLFVVIGVTILPGWMAVSITYRVGGVASVAINNVRSFTLMDQSTALGSAVAAGLVTTGVVMPLVYGLLYNGIPSAAGWCTAFTVFMTSCAGLIHINRFVQYVLAGEAGGMDDFYNGHATIEWPLWLHCVPGVLVYVAVVCDFLGVRRRLSAYCRCGRESTRQRAKAESNPIS